MKIWGSVWELDFDSYYYNMDNEIENKNFTQEDIDNEIRKITLDFEEKQRNIKDLCRLLKRGPRIIEKILGRKYLYRKIGSGITSDREIY